MEDFMYEAKKMFKKYKAEVFLIILSIITTIIGGSMYLKESKNEPNEDKMIVAQPAIKETPPTQEKLYIDISGAVKKPNLYQATPGSRLKHILDAAGGLSEDADMLYFSRYYNVAKILQDEEKIYIPSQIEVANGLFSQEMPITQNTTSSTNETALEQNTSTKININTASLPELESLPGIGAVTAQKIIDARPYASVEDLVSLKVISATTLEKIRDSIE